MDGSRISTQSAKLLAAWPRHKALKLWMWELRGGGKARTLRITIDKPEGVTHEDCAMVSRDVSTILDVEDAVKGPSYTLEVSSPGLDRPLKRPEDYRRFTGSILKLTTREPINGNRHFEARLKRFEEGKLILETIPRQEKAEAGTRSAGATN